MKKRVFFLLLAALMMPLAMNAQNNASVHIDTTVNACVSYTWPVNGMTFTTSGVHTAIIGDTLYILDLTINPVYNITVSDPVQGGCTYTWGDSVYITPGTHTQTFQSVNNCDSTVTINLALTTSATMNYTVTACDYYIWKGDTLRTTGIVNYTDTTNVNCDSLLTLDLTIIAPLQKNYDTTIVACEKTRFRFSPTSSWTNVEVDGTVITSEAYSQSTAAARNLFHPRTVERCYDSLVTITFNIRQKGVFNYSDHSCDSYTFTVNGEDHIYNYSKVDTISADKAVNGCDSLVVLNITIHKSPEVYITGDLRVAPHSDAVLHANSNQNVNYTWSNGQTSESITLSNVEGNVDVWLKGSNTTTGCESTAYVTVMANLAIENVDSDMLNVYPNPTCAKVNINSVEPLKNVSVFNMMGQQVINAETANTVDLSNLNNGAYVIRIEMQNGTVATRTVVLSK